MTCDCEGTIEDVLMRSTDFKELAKKNEKKELVILKEGKPISANFPCNLIANVSPLLIHYATKNNQRENIEKESTADTLSIGNRFGNSVLFHLCTSGEDNIKMILENQNIKNKFPEMTIYAYEGETVETALQRDGRFNDDVFQKKCGLIQVGTDSIFEFSSNVFQSIENKLFKIYLKKTNNKSHEKSPGSVSDAYKAEEDDQDPSQRPSTSEMGNINTPKKKPKLNVSKAFLGPKGEIPESENIVQDLTQRFDDALEEILIHLKGMKIQEFLRVEYEKNDKKCREVRVMKKLMELSDSICLVVINNHPCGTGFLLFDQFVLTNFHVIKDGLRQRGNVCVRFMFEEVNQAREKEVKVVEAVVSQYKTDDLGNSYDWALLKLAETSALSCPCLLEHFGYLPPTGGICIIGHPDCGVKMVDPCYIIPNTKYSKTVKKHKEKNSEGIEVRVPQSKPYEAVGRTQWVGPKYFDDVENEMNKRKPVVGYNTCFYFGSSGSPVFDNSCKVVAVHSGGYLYRNKKDYSKKRSIINYGYLLSNILEDMIVQLVDKKSWDVLKKLLSVNNTEMENIKTGVKELTKRRGGLTSFEHALLAKEVMDNTLLKDFFQSICQEEEADMEV